MSWICKRPSGSRALSPALWSPSRKNMLAPELPRILINAMGGGVGEGSKEKGQISGGHSHFLMNNFITLALGQHLFLNFHPYFG